MELDFQRLPRTPKPKPGMKNYSRMYSNSDQQIQPSQADYAYQKHILQGVSRTFALTIPQLPENLSSVVSNAYLLCRIADTIEDDKDMDFADKKIFAERFIDVVAATAAADVFKYVGHL